MPLTTRIKEINKVDDIDLEAAITNMDDMLKYVRTAVL
ncbi:MAG: pilus assembly protein CpaF [Clostridiales bacterium]|jgi:hypothetical protein|nr:pilus assembly protein CpaF [Clostridiales bacterium]